MQKKTEIQDFKILEIELRDQLFLKGGDNATETVTNTNDSHSPSGYSDDCGVKFDGTGRADSPLTTERRPRLD